MKLTLTTMAIALTVMMTAVYSPVNALPSYIIETSATATAETTLESRDSETIIDRRWLMKPRGYGSDCRKSSQCKTGNCYRLKCIEDEGSRLEGQECLFVIECAPGLNRCRSWGSFGFGSYCMK